MLDEEGCLEVFLSLIGADGRKKPFEVRACPGEGEDGVEGRREEGGKGREGKDLRESYFREYCSESEGEEKGEVMRESVCACEREKESTLCVCV